MTVERIGKNHPLFRDMHSPLMYPLLRNAALMIAFLFAVLGLFFLVVYLMG